MTPRVPLQQITTILQNWQGSDDAARPTPQQIAAEIDLAYRDHLKDLEAQIAAAKDLEHVQQCRLAS